MSSDSNNSKETDQLFEAVNKNDIKKVEELLSSGVVDVDLRNPKEENRTALHIAAQKGRYELVSLLADKYHANVNIEDNKEDIPLQLATDRYHMKIVKFLLSRNSNKREYAAHHLNSDQVEELFQAAHENNIEKVTQLINANVDVNSEDISDFHRSILEVAASRGYYGLVRTIVEDYGADMQHEDDSGECAYHKAVNNKHDNIANFLLERGFQDTYNTVETSSDSDGSLHFPG